MKIAILVPCYNEELTIADVICDFQKELPEAHIYVYDNNSKDNTSNIARDNGAIVKIEKRQGKGNVVRSMFRDIEADIYIMVDGDNTYPASFVHKLMIPVIKGEADMVVGDRLSNLTYFKENKRKFHNLGNTVVCSMINKLFKCSMKDIMSGYRVFNHYFIKNTPILSPGFEVETEMSLHALDKKFRIIEIPIKYKDRPNGSESKLNTFSDGFKVIKTIIWIFKDYKPLIFFSFWGTIFFLIGIGLGIFPIYEYLIYKFVYRVPTAMLAMGMVIFAFLCFGIGLILDTVSKIHKLDYELQLNNYKQQRDKKND